MEFGIQFFPDVGPEDKPANIYFDECMRLCELCDQYGYTHIRTVEHYFKAYGGYSPAEKLNQHMLEVMKRKSAARAWVREDTE